jgi:thiol-disulfide isomerase/thioredoxin
VKRVRPRRRLPAVLATLVVLSVATGCGGGSGLSAGDQGFVSGDGKVTVLDAADREEPQAEVAGETVDGDEVALADHLGKVVVMPVWGSWCAPCRAEAPLLAEAAKDLEDDGVVFLGINSRDPNVTEARQFVDDFAIPYDSIHDPDGRTLLAFHGTLPPQTVPSFVFIDAEGRVAGRALDKIGRSTLYGVVEDVLGHPLSSEQPEEPS